MPKYFKASLPIALGGENCQFWPNQNMLDKLNLMSDYLKMGNGLGWCDREIGIPTVLML